MSQIIETQPVPEHIARALDALDSIGDDDPDLDQSGRATLAAAPCSPSGPLTHPDRNSRQR